MDGGKNRDVKRRILAIERMLLEGKTINSTQIIRRLDLQYDIQVDKKTIYSDIIAIDLFIPIEHIPGRNGGYRIMEFI